jgi:hypothetical protein
MHPTTGSIVALLVLLPAAAHAQNRAAPVSATSSWEAAYDARGEEARSTLVNRGFAFTTQEIGGRAVRILLSQEIRATVRADREGVDGRVRTTAYARTGRAFNRALWSIDAPGDAAGMDYDLYWVREPGCCATQPTRHFFSLRTGRAILDATSDVASLPADPDEPRRRVGFLSANGTVRHPAFAGARDAIGILQLAVGESVRQRVLIRFTDPVPESEAPVIGVMVRSAGRGALPASTVWLRFSDGREARIPVTAAGFALEGATLPAGISARTVR